MRNVVTITLLAMLCACQPQARAPRRYLAITHPALNRVTFFDLDARKVVGVLPAQKLPHDMALSADARTLYVVNSGAQCLTAYHLDAPELWREARAFMRRDTARARPIGGSMFGTPDPSGAGASRGDSGGRGGRTAAPHPLVSAARDGDSAVTFSPTRTEGGVLLNPEPIHRLPASIAEFHLTDPSFPERARAAHDRVGATAHRSCFNCHERTVGAKPFGLAFTPDGGSLVVTHLAGRNLTLLDAGTLAIRRQIPLAVPDHLAPVEARIGPGSSVAFVTCRDEIGQSRRGVILVVDLDTGATIATLTAGIYPWHLVPDVTGNRLFVNNFQSSRISIVDAAERRIVDSLIVQNGPATMIPSADGTRLYVSCFYTHRVVVVNLATRQVERAIAVGSNPTSLLPSADGRELLVLCGGESTLELVDLTSFTVRERHRLLFGAYAFQLVDRERPVRRLPAAGPLVPFLPSLRGAAR